MLGNSIVAWAGYSGEGGVSNWVFGIAKINRFPSNLIKYILAYGFHTLFDQFICETSICIREDICMKVTGSVSGWVNSSVATWTHTISLATFAWVILNLNSPQIILIFKTNHIEMFRWWLYSMLRLQGCLRLHFLVIIILKITGHFNTHIWGILTIIIYSLNL